MIVRGMALSRPNRGKLQPTLQWWPFLQIGFVDDMTPVLFALILHFAPTPMTACLCPPPAAYIALLSWTDEWQRFLIPNFVHDGRRLSLLVQFDRTPMARSDTQTVSLVTNAGLRRSSNSMTNVCKNLRRGQQPRSVVL